MRNSKCLVPVVPSLATSGLADIPHSDNLAVRSEGKGEWMVAPMACRCAVTSP